jgi:hypothetical protein
MSRSNRYACSIRLGVLGTTLLKKWVRLVLYGHDFEEMRIERRRPPILLVSNEGTFLQQP